MAEENLKLTVSKDLLKLLLEKMGWTLLPAYRRSKLVVEKVQPQGTLPALVEGRNVADLFKDDGFTPKRDLPRLWRNGTELTVMSVAEYQKLGSEARWRPYTFEEIPVTLQGTTFKDYQFYWETRRRDNAWGLLPKERVPADGQFVEGRDGYEGLVSFDENEMLSIEAFASGIDSSPVSEVYMPCYGTNRHVVLQAVGLFPLMEDSVVN